MNNSEIRNVTKELLKGKYKNVMLPFLLATLLLSLTQQQELYSSTYEAYGLSYVFTIGSLALFVQGPISIGLATYSLSIANEKEYSYTQIISAFKYFFKALILVLLVLMQKSEGGALGIGVSQENMMFSKSAGNFMTKATGVVATLFIICSLALTIVSRGDLTPSSSVLDQVEEDTPTIPENNN